MPTYTYRCRRCGSITEELRPIRKRMADTSCEDCGGPAEWVISAPTLAIWNAERKFPNLSPHGDGTMTFGSKSDYELHCKEKHLGEVSTGGRLKRPRSAKVTTYG